MKAWLAIQAAAAMEDGLVSPAHVGVDPCPREQGSQRVNDAATLDKAPPKGLETIITIMAQGAAQGTALQAHAQPLQRHRQQLRHRFGRQCRGMGQVFVTRVRQTESPLRDIRDQVRPLAQAAQAHLHGAPQRFADHRDRLDSQLRAALAVPQRIAHQSRQLTQGKAVTHGKLVNADDPTMAPMCQGQSPCAAPFGRKPGIIVEPATGVIVGLHVPVGNPRNASSVQPLIDRVQHTSARISTAPSPTIYSRAGAWACHDASLREGLHQQGLLPVGIPHTVEPLPPSPTPEDVLQLLNEGDLPRARPACQVHLAYACGYSRPVVERLMASLLSRGAARLTDNGHRGANVQRGMAVLAHPAATLVRIHSESRALSGSVSQTTGHFCETVGSRWTFSVGSSCRV